MKREPGPASGPWRRPATVLDPLALLLRARYRSRADLARASGLGYQTLRTYTDARWTADRPPPVRVLAALSTAVDPLELQRAVRESLAARREQADGVPVLAVGQRAVLEALRGFDDDVLVAAAPCVHEAVAALAATRPDEAVRTERTQPSPTASVVPGGTATNLAGTGS